MATGSARRWRQALVWLHVLTSVGWMTSAGALALLLGLSRSDPGAASAAVDMAHYLDTRLLAPLANASASTGLMLSLTTAWGLLHHWWVATKFAVTLSQLYVGIGVLSIALDDVAAGRAPAPGLLVVASAAMAGAIAFQAWLSVTKPWPRTSLARRDRARGRTKLPTAGTPLVAAAVLAPLGDTALGEVLGFPSPLLQLLLLTVATIARRRALRATRPPVAARTPSPATVV